MPGYRKSDAPRCRSPWRIARWSAAALILLLPLVAMQFTDEVNWTMSDFVFAGILLCGALGAYELAARSTGDPCYRAGAGLAIATLFLLSWSNAAVGITDGKADFWIFWGVPFTTFAGALIARFRPWGLAHVMIASALVLVLITLIALAAGLVPPYNSVFEILGIAGIFVAMFAAAGLFFRQAWRSAIRAENARR